MDTSWGKRRIRVSRINRKETTESARQCEIAIFVRWKFGARTINTSKFFWFPLL